MRAPVVSALGPVDRMRALGIVEQIRCKWDLMPTFPAVSPEEVACLSDLDHETYSIAAALALQTGASTIVYEANPDLLVHIEDTAQLNGVSASVQVLHGAVVGDARAHGAMVDFHTSREFWASSLRSGTYLAKGAISVPCVDWRQALAGAEIAFIDIEGEERNLFLQEAPSSLRTVLVEVHTPAIGTEVAAELMNRLWGAGFRMVDAKGLTQVWRKA